MATYMATSINDSVVISGVAGEDIADVRGRIVGYNANGLIELAKDSTKVIGVGIQTNGDAGAVKTGEQVDIQIKDIGMVCVGAAVEAGAPLCAGTGGKAEPLTAGKTCIGFALKKAAAAGQMIPVQICKSVSASTQTNQTENQDGGN